jgi:hypothetical protein
MPYLLEWWQQHVARVGDALVARNMPIWDQDGWCVRVLTSAGWKDAGLGVFPCRESAERAALRHIASN